MRIVFLSTGCWDKNASMVRPRELGRHLLDLGAEVAYVLDEDPHNRTKTGLDPRAELFFSPRPRGAGQFLRRRQTLKSAKPDFVHVMNPAPKTFATLYGTNHRVIGDWDEWPARRSYPFFRLMLERFIDRWLRRRSAQRIVASRWLQEQFRSEFGLQTVYIPYATYLPDYPETTSPFREPTAVYMGNLFPSYDHDLIIEAAEILARNGKRFPMRLMGEGPDLAKWRDYVARRGLNNVDIAGYVTGLDLWANLRHAHVLLFPIRPTVLNLARCPSKTFAYGQARRPIITNRVGEVAEVLGDRAIYVEPTPAAFAEALERVMEAPAEPDRDYEIERHNWRDRAGRFLETLKGQTDPRLPAGDKGTIPNGA